MRRLTAVTPATSSLPVDLRLLSAPIRVTGLLSGRDHEARAEGVILDEDRRVVAFVVRISERLAPGAPRTLVPVSALSPSESGLDLSWSEDKLLEHPRLDERAHEGSPAEHADHEGGDANRQETINGAAAGTALGAGLGAIAAFAFPPIGVLAMAAFFAAGGLLVGAAAGATQHALPDETDETDELSEHSSAFKGLEQALRNPAIEASGVVHVTLFDLAPKTLDETVVRV